MVLYRVLHMIDDVRWYSDILVNGDVVDATLTTVSFKPPVMNSILYVREGTFLIFGAGWRGCLFFLSLFSFSCVPSSFLPVFLWLYLLCCSLSLAPLDRIAVCWICWSGFAFSWVAKTCVMFVAMAVGFLNISYWKPSLVLCTVKQ